MDEAQELCKEYVPILCNMDKLLFQKGLSRLKSMWLLLLLWLWTEWVDILLTVSKHQNLRLWVLVTVLSLL